MEMPFPLEIRRFHPVTYIKEKINKNPCAFHYFHYSGLEKAWDKMEEKYKESFGKAQQQVKNIKINQSIYQLYFGW